MAIVLPVIFYVEHGTIYFYVPSTGDRWEAQIKTGGEKSEYAKPRDIGYRYHHYDQENEDLEPAPFADTEE
jgi:hypothetical protein